MIPQLDYAVFVWSSYAVAAAVVAWQFIQPRIRRRRLLGEIRERRNAAAGGDDDTHA